MNARRGFLVLAASLLGIVLAYAGLSGALFYASYGRLPLGRGQTPSGSPSVRLPIRREGGSARLTTNSNVTMRQRFGTTTATQEGRLEVVWW